MKKILLFIGCALTLSSCNFAEVMGELADGTSIREGEQAAKQNFEQIGPFIFSGGDSGGANRSREKEYAEQALQQRGSLY